MATPSNDANTYVGQRDGLLRCRRYRRPVPLDPERVPPQCRTLLALAERWGVGDDYEREALVSAASEAELRTLVSAVDAVPDDALYGWLSGPESHDARPTPEYLAVTNMTMAADSARTRLRR